jgi:hypothetical protein
MSGEGYCMHAERLQSSAHANWMVSLDTQAGIGGQDQNRAEWSGYLRGGSDA